MTVIGFLKHNILTIAHYVPIILMILCGQSINLSTINDILMTVIGFLKHNILTIAHYVPIILMILCGQSINLSTINDILMTVIVKKQKNKTIC